jgi:proteasome accessory factor B
MASDDKLERLMNLVAALVDATLPITAEQIQRRVAGYPEGATAFRRTFERDKDELRELGVPVTTVPVPGTYPEETGYEVLRSRYEMPDANLEPDELAAVRLALQSVQVGDPEDTIAAALRRLGGAVDAAGPDLVPDARLIADLPVDASLVPLFSAVMERRVARFDYGHDGERSRRSVEPWHLEFRRGHWYLAAHDLDRGGSRNFRLDRIHGDVELDRSDTFMNPVPTSLETPDDPWRYGEGESVTAVVRIDASQAPWALAILGEASVRERHPDGSFIFAVPVTTWPAFRSFVLSFLDHAELIGPAELRDDLVNWLEALADSAAP